MTPLVTRDERTMAVENAGYRWSYLLLSFGLLVIVAVRSFVLGESNWDLMGLVILGGGVNAIYQGSRQVLTRRWVMTTVVTFVVAALLAAAMVFARAAR
jgi:hypothetical protein